MGATKSLLVLQLVPMMMGLIGTTIGQGTDGQLLLFRDYLGDGPYFDDWNPTVSYCKWTGITCAEDGSTVTGIKVNTSDNAKDGIIPKNLAYFTALEDLFIGYDLPRVIGPIPNNINGLTSLKTLAIIGTNVNGQVPAELGLIPNLVNLYLSNNKFTGDIETLTSAPKLELLDLRYNSLSAAQLPTVLPIALKTLLLDGNQYQGEITIEVANTWGGLEQIGLSDNQLTGDPQPLFEAAKSPLKVLSLAGNKFQFNMTTTVLPTGLTTLDLSRNQIYGTISPQVNKLVRLKKFSARVNLLFGEIPAGVLSTMQPSDFEYNVCLCGAPLDACPCCLAIPPPSPPPASPPPSPPPTLASPPPPPVTPVPPARHVDLLLQYRYLPHHLRRPYV